MFRAKRAGEARRVSLGGQGNEVTNAPLVVGVLSLRREERRGKVVRGEQLFARNTDVLPAMALDDGGEVVLKPTAVAIRLLAHGVHARDLVGVGHFRED